MTAQALDTQIIERIHAAFNRRDLDAIAAELTPDVVFHQIPGAKGAPPTMRGRDEAMQSFEAMMQLGRQRIEHHNAEELAGYVVGIGTATFTVAGEDRSFQIIDVCRLRDGKLAERWGMLDRPDELERIVADLAGEAQATSA